MKNYIEVAEESWVKPLIGSDLYDEIEEQIENIKNGKPYVIRFKSNGNHENKVAVTDLVKGNLDAVIIDEAPAKLYCQKIDGAKLLDIVLTQEEYEKKKKDLLDF